MFRRQFLQSISLASATALPLLLTRTGSAAAQQTVKLHVSGFTCVTCAVGLETLLRKHPGVSFASASYRASNVLIHFDTRVVDQPALIALISDMGVTATPEPLP